MATCDCWMCSNPSFRSTCAAAAALVAVQEPAPSPRDAGWLN